MKNKKGFTLIELLAVIVVLAIIALIATPIVMNTIKNAKKGAAERGAESYVKQVELTIATEELDKHYVEDGKYQITSDGNLCRDKSATCTEENKIKIEMNGTKPNGGTIKIENGQVSTTGTSMKMGDYTVSYDTTTKIYVAKEQGAQELLCTAVAVATLGNVPTGEYNYGDEYLCNVGDGERIFYVLENNTDTVSLILNENLGENVEWITDNDWQDAGGVVTDEMRNDGSACQYADICITTEYGPITLNNALKTRTSGWTKLHENQISIPTYEQINNVPKKPLDDGGYVMNGLQFWLHSSNYSGEGYWTSTFYESNPAAYGTNKSEIGIKNQTITTELGVRPVITISKSQLG